MDTDSLGYIVVHSGIWVLFFFKLRSGSCFFKGSDLNLDPVLYLPQDMVPMDTDGMAWVFGSDPGLFLLLLKL